MHSTQITRLCIVCLAGTPRPRDVALDLIQTPGCAALCRPIRSPQNSDLYLIVEENQEHQDRCTVKLRRVVYCRSAAVAAATLGKAVNLLLMIVFPLLISSSI